MAGFGAQHGLWALLAALAFSTDRWILLTKAQASPPLGFKSIEKSGFYQSPRRATH